MTQPIVVGPSAAARFRPLPFNSGQAAARRPARLEGRFEPVLHRPAYARGSMGQAPFAAVQKAFQGDSLIPNWLVYSSSGLLVVGGIMGLSTAPEKTAMTYVLNLGMVALGSYLFYKTI